MEYLIYRIDHICTFISSVFSSTSTGHFLPAIAHAIQESNKQGKFRHLNLKGVLLGNPAISEIYLQAYYPFYAVKNGLISKVSAQLSVTAIENHSYPLLSFYIQQ